MRSSVITQHGIFHHDGPSRPSFALVIPKRTRGDTLVLWGDSEGELRARARGRGTRFELYRVPEDQPTQSEAAQRVAKVMKDLDYTVRISSCWRRSPGRPGVGSRAKGAIPERVWLDLMIYVEKDGRRSWIKIDSTTLTGRGVRNATGLRRVTECLAGALIQPEPIVDGASVCGPQHGRARWRAQISASGEATYEPV